MWNLVTLSVLILALGVASCGKEQTQKENKKWSESSSSNASTPPPIEPPEEREEVDGTYLAVLVPLNLTVAGNVKGAFTLSRDKDELVGDVRLTGGGAGLLHAQNVHIGTACPIEKDDTNNDGFIDYVEGSKLFGEIVMPLDADLSSQDLGAGIFPVADQYGNYIYSKVASYEQFLKDLKEPDLNPTDQLVKIGEGQKADLAGKVVVIQGVPETTPLPNTVQSFGGFANFQTLPIACGVIMKVEETPGEIDGDSAGTTTGGSAGGDDGATIKPPPREETSEDQALGAVFHTGEG